MDADCISNIATVMTDINATAAEIVLLLHIVLYLWNSLLLLLWITNRTANLLKGCDPEGTAQSL